MRVSLRELSPEDLDDEYFSWYTKEDDLLKTFTGSRRSFDTDSIVEDIKKGADSGAWFYWVIVDNNSGAKIGNVKIGPIDFVNKTSDLVCFIGNRSFLGLGLAKEAISIGTRIAFDKYDIRRLHGGMYENNISSIKAYVAAGWNIEGRLIGYYWVDGKPVDRILVSCLNEKFFGDLKD